MKKTIFFILINFTICINVLAQNFKDLRLNFGFQGNLPERLFNSNIPIYNNKNGGGGIHIYPKWFYNKQNSVGVNIEYNFVTENYQTDAIGVFNIISICPTLNHYFFQPKIRPFIGIGAGTYSVLFHTPKLNLGFKSLVGMSIYQYIDISLEYNRILNKINIDPDVMGDFDNYYLGIKASVSLGLIKTKN